MSLFYNHLRYEHKHELVSLVKHLKKEKRFVWAQKKQLKYKLVKSLSDTTSYTMLIYSDVQPLEIITRLQGQTETKNTLKYGDILVTGPQEEQYVIAFSKFHNLYDVVDGIATPRCQFNKVAKVTESDWKQSGILSSQITFKASWGEDMILKIGDYIVEDGTSFYRIEKTAFKKTYRHLSNSDS